MLTKRGFGVIQTFLASYLGLAMGAFFCVSNVFSQQSPIQLEVVYAGDKSLNFRGLYALSDQTVWASGNLGTVVFTNDAGQTWQTIKVPDAGHLQFRDIHLFDEKTALIMGSGWPTHIYKTADAGVNWRLVYVNNDSSVFLNSFDFWPDGSGICFGDPVNGTFFMLKTTDFGEHWEAFEGPPAEKGEVGFAASGTSLVCFADSAVIFGSGGAVSHIFKSPNRGQTWAAELSGLASGSPSKGVFGIALNGFDCIAVGGDYRKESERDKTSAVFVFKNEEVISGQPKGLPYQSAVIWYDSHSAISVGTTGCYFSTDFGLSWIEYAITPLHTISKARTGNSVFAAGPDGRIYKLVIMHSCGTR
jgi:photosystem II stability/assembly factor-like uncharacterized protein